MSGVLQDTFLWNSMGMHTCSVWLSNNVELARQRREAAISQKNAIEDKSRVAHN